MQVDTGEFRALAAEVAAMRTEMAGFAEVVETFRNLTLPVDVIYRAGRADEREAILGGHRPRRPRRERDGRPDLRVVTG